MIVINLIHLLSFSSYDIHKNNDRRNKTLRLGTEDRNENFGKIDSTLIMLFFLM